MLRWIRDRWYRRLRRIDLEILWPSCKSEAPDLIHAKAVFALHCFNDRVWMRLGHDEVCRIINELE